VAHDVIRSEQADRDLADILEHLFASHIAFGEGPPRAAELAGARLRRIHTAMEKLGRMPHQGALRPEMLPGLRVVTKERAVFYFLVDDAQNQVRVLAVFFGGQDQQREMLKRVMG
jgi:toxin ParE1/3/4